MGGQTTNTEAPGVASGSGAVTKVNANTAQTKNYFAYHGNGKDPNQESIDECINFGPASAAHAKPTTVKVKNFTLKLNGQTKHLDGQACTLTHILRENNLSQTATRWRPVYSKRIGLREYLV